MGFVVPAEIGHAPYAAPLIRYLLTNFRQTQIIAIQEKLFPDLSEDCWLLFCDGFGGKSSSILLSDLSRFKITPRPPQQGRRVTLGEWERMGQRLRPFLLSPAALELYNALSVSASRLSSLARIGIGYVTGANDFFHLRPSVARRLNIDGRFLIPAIRKGRDLAEEAISKNTVFRWQNDDDPNFLLRLRHDEAIPDPVWRYLDSADGRRARNTYKCRHRDPWYVVPDVHVPDGFLSYMSGKTPSLVANAAGCVATNSVHVVRVKPGISVARLQNTWGDPLTQLSCEIEGHPLGGGMLKLEPREAGQVLVRREASQCHKETETLMEAVSAMRRWRHYG